jgi:Peptidase family S41/N-terminal domain of Peptidase_S41 in eukaryotic IRBP
MSIRPVAAFLLLVSSPAWAQLSVAEGPMATVQPLRGEDRSAAIAEITRKLEERYVFPDRVAAIRARLKDGMTSGRYDIENPPAFAGRVTEDLRAASGDRHLYLNYAPGQFAAARAGDGKSDNRALEAFWERRARRDNQGLGETRILPGNIRYLRITAFEWVQDQTGVAYDAAMRFLRDGDAIVIDLRGNGGGSHAAVRYLLSHFMGADELDITFLQAGKDPVQSRTLDYLPAGRLKGKPLYVLISDQVGSAAEAFAYDVQQFRLGTLVGATTAGAANNNEFSPVAPGFMLSLSYGRPVHPVSKTNWEGVGVKPDVATDPDRALDLAQSLALAALLDRSGSDAGDRAEWEWARPAVDARVNPPRLQPAAMRQLAGRYGSQRILWSGGALHLARKNGKMARLIPLTKDGLFGVEGYDDHLHIRLTGEVMELQWSDEAAATRLPRSKD